LTAAQAAGISFPRVMLPLVGASLVAAVLDLGLTELSPVTSIRRAELLGERQVRSTPSRYNFVYRADGGWVYAIRSLEIATREMRDLILEREGSGPEYPTIVIAAQRASYDSSQRRPRSWPLTKGSVRYLLEPGWEAAFTFDGFRTRALTETRA